MSGRQSLADRLHLTLGVIRSLRIYYGDRPRHHAMDALYAQFVQPGNLIFDIGSHVGDRVASFRRLGCQVVAVEPQPHLARLLKLFYSWRDVPVIQAAVGATEGHLDLHLNLANPTTATGSHAFIAAAGHADGWRDQRWTKRVRVPQTTLDALIIAHGQPDFVKIDVEGLEADVLAGLSRAIAALSFEFTTIQRDVAVAALDRCAALGRYEFNAALGESQKLLFDSWLDAAEMTDWLNGLPEAANSGDIYARLLPRHEAS